MTKEKKTTCKDCGKEIKKVVIGMNRCFECMRKVKIK